MIFDRPGILDIADSVVDEMDRTLTVRAEQRRLHTGFFSYLGREKDFIREELGRKHPESGDLAYPSSSEFLVDALFEHRFVVCRSPRKFSKTFSAADLAIAVFATRPSVVLLLGPTLRQLEGNLWAQIQRTYDRCPHLPGERLKTSIRCGPLHYMEPVSTNSPDRMQGYHADTPIPPDTFNRDPEEGEIERIIEEARRKIAEGKASAQAAGSMLFIVLEECFGIPSAIIEALEGSMQGPNVMVLAVGNPTKSPAEGHPAVRWCIDESSPFYRIKFSHLSEEIYPDPIGADKVFDRGYGAEWAVGEDRAGKFGLSSFIADHQWVENKEREWGPESSLFKAHVLGQLAGEDQQSQVIPGDMISAATGACKLPGLGPSIGVDVSAGGDLCVMVLMLNGRVEACFSWRPVKTDPTVTMNVARKIKEVVRNWSKLLLAAGKIKEPIKGSDVHVDFGTFGRGICERLYELSLPVDRVDFGRKPRYRWGHLHAGMRFNNLRTEMHFDFRRGLQERLFEVPDTPEFAKIREQLQWPLYHMKEDGEGTFVALEKKEKIIDRHGASPDFADATVLAGQGNGTGNIPGVY